MPKEAYAAHLLNKQVDSGAVSGCMACSSSSLIVAYVLERQPLVFCGPVTAGRQCSLTVDFTFSQAAGLEATEPELRACYLSAADLPMPAGVPCSGWGLAG